MPQLLLPVRRTRRVRAGGLCAVCGQRFERLSIMVATDEGQAHDDCANPTLWTEP